MKSWVAKSFLMNICEYEGGTYGVIIVEPVKGSTFSIVCHPHFMRKIRSQIIPTALSVDKSEEKFLQSLIDELSTTVSKQEIEENYIVTMLDVKLDKSLVLNIISVDLSIKVEFPAFALNILAKELDILLQRTEATRLH